MKTAGSFYFPPDSAVDMGSGFHGLREVEHLRVGSLFPPEVDAVAELLLAKVILTSPESIRLHMHPAHSEAIFVLKGAVTAQRGRARAEIETRGAAYFPAGVPHSVEAVPGRDAELLMFYPRADIRKGLTSSIIEGDEDESEWPSPNVVKGQELLWRWAVAEESEPWIPTEPTKGFDLTIRILFDPPRGAPDLVVGTGMQKPNRHYTIHRHAPAEFYHILGGHGVYYIGDETYEIEQGSTLYVPAMVPHGADSYEGHVNDFWVYGLDGSGPAWVWEALEDIYNVPRKL